MATNTNSKIPTVDHLVEQVLSLDETDLQRTIAIMETLKNRPVEVEALSIKRDCGVLTDRQWLEQIEALAIKEVVQ